MILSFGLGLLFLWLLNNLYTLYEAHKCMPPKEKGEERSKEDVAKFIMQNMPADKMQLLGHMATINPALGLGGVVSIMLALLI